MTKHFSSLKEWVDKLAELIQENREPGTELLISFVHEPELALGIVDLINSLDETDIEDERSYYSACIYALDICVAQLQTSIESNHKLAQKILDKLMEKLSVRILEYKHSLSFWLPILNAFYNVHVELTPKLRDAYVDLANHEENYDELDEKEHIDAIRDMVLELSDLSTFDIAENFFAQSYAMPPDFFIELTIDLFNIIEGQDIAILSLLHPNYEVRELILPVFDELMNTVKLSSKSLTRIQAIKAWYHPNHHPHFLQWIKWQRLKEVVFDTAKKEAKIIKIYASEIDGRGIQSVFLHIKHDRKKKLCGILLSDVTGIKDVWITPPLADTFAYYNDNFDTTLSLREVSTDYVGLMVNHFLAITIKHNSMPDLHLLEIQELLQEQFVPEPIDKDFMMKTLAEQMPSSEINLQESFKRSKSWLNSKTFTESWYVESANIDRLVNQCSSFIDGVRVCNIEEAKVLVFQEELECQRERWLFHFLWLTLWLKARTRKNEKTWQDSFCIMDAIRRGMPLSEIPVLQEICYQSVINSIETMNERRTYLHKQ